MLDFPLKVLSSTVNILASFALKAKCEDILQLVPKQELINYLVKLGLVRVIHNKEGIFWRITGEGRRIARLPEDEQHREIQKTIVKEQAPKVCALCPKTTNLIWFKGHYFCDQHLMGKEIPIVIGDRIASSLG